MILPAVAVSGFALLPIAYLLVRASEAGGDRIFELLWRERMLTLALRSLWLAGSVTFACIVIGVLLAFLVTRTDLPGRRIWTVVAVLPLAVPSYVAAYTWIAAVPGLAGYWGSLLVLTACTYPYVFLVVAALLLSTDAGLEDVARSLGRSRLRTFFTVTLPQVRPAIAAGGLLVALYVLSDFGAVSLMRYDVFTRVIFTSYRSSFDRTPAAVLGLVLVVITVAITVAEARSRGRLEQARVGGGVARSVPPLRLTRAQRAAGVAFAGAVAAIAVGFPLVSLGYWVARAAEGSFDVARLTSAAVSTLTVSLLAGAATVVLALPVGILAARESRPWARATEHAAYAAHALPGLVVALAMVFIGIRVVPSLYLETPLLVATYVVLFLPLAVGSVRASVALSTPRLEETASSLGLGPGRVFAQVTLPLAAPGVAAGAALVVLTCMKELPATLLLRPTGMDTLATELWTLTFVPAYGEAAPYAALLVLLAAIPTVLLTRTFWPERSAR